MLIPSFQSISQTFSLFSEVSSIGRPIMNDIDHIRKLLADVKAGEKGWRKVLATAEGSFSKKLAQENLRRLAALRLTLLNQLKAVDEDCQPMNEGAAKHGMITGDVSESAAERLLRRR
jgi:hypothetical protein